MKTLDLYHLICDPDMKPFYSIPVGHTFRHFIWLPDRPDQYLSNYAVKENEHEGLLHDGLSMMVKSTDLVSEVINEDSITY
jgi:hypothetical protein